MYIIPYPKLAVTLKFIITTASFFLKFVLFVFFMDCID